MDTLTGLPDPRDQIPWLPIAKSLGNHLGSSTKANKLSFGTRAITVAEPTFFTGLSAVAYQLSCVFAKRSQKDFRPAVAYPFACLIMSTTFVEAYFNEIIELQSRVGALIAETAECLRRISLKQKLDGLLYDLAAKKWDKGRDPYQSFHQLLELRDELVHYKPKFHRVGEFPRRGIELVARKFRHGWFGRTDWPVLVLTPTVANWACQTARTMVEEFHRLTGTADPWKQDLPGWSEKWWDRTD